jgi:phytoene synthase
VTDETRNVSRRSGRRGISSLADFVREHDRDRYQTALFAPADRRQALFALYAFNYEVARVRESVTQPMLGQIRLQWWREAIEAAYSGAPPRRHVVVEPLTGVIRALAPSRAHFARLIDTRERDLADEPPATLAELTDYAEGTSGTLLYLVLEVLGESEPVACTAARAVGIGYALAGLLRALPFHARSGRCYVPVELIERAGIDPRAYAALCADAGLRAAVAEIAEIAAGHLRAARRHQAAMTRPARKAMLPAVIADRFLLRLGRANFDPFAPQLAQPDTLQGWRLFAAALRRRV